MKKKKYSELVILKIKEFIIKYKDEIFQITDIHEKTLNDMIDMYFELIIKSKRFEKSLKLSRKFSISLTEIDRTYYFNKMLSKYETISSVLKHYSESDESRKKQNII